MVADATCLCALLALQHTSVTKFKATRQRMFNKSAVSQKTIATNISHDERHGLTALIARKVIIQKGLNLRWCSAWNVCRQLAFKEIHARGIVLSRLSKTFFGTGCVELLRVRYHWWWRGGVHAYQTWQDARPLEPSHVLDWSCNP